MQRRSKVKTEKSAEREAENLFGVTARRRKTLLYIIMVIMFFAILVLITFFGARNASSFGV